MLIAVTKEGEGVSVNQTKQVVMESTAPPLLEAILRKEFPEATHAECQRFITACRYDGKRLRDDDEIKQLAESRLEEYFDWRSCYGLDYGPKTKQDDEDLGAPAKIPAANESTETAIHTPSNAKDSEDWKFAVRKALEVAESIQRAQELQKKLSEDATRPSDEAVQQKDPYADLEAKIMVDGSNSSAGKEDESDNGDGETNGNDVKSPKMEEHGGSESTAAANAIAERKRKYELPQVVFVHRTEGGNDGDDSPVDVTDNDGKLLVHVLPARIDRKLASAETYGLALALYLDSKFDRNTTESITVLVDTRPGEGWPNPMSITMINFVKKVSDMVLKYYPGRLNKLILTPIPKSTWYIWKSIKLLFPNRMELVQFIYGQANVASPLPVADLKQHIPEQVIKISEQVRKDNFKPIGTYKLW